MLINYYTICIQGRIQDFKLGGALKKLRRAEGGANIFGVFRVKNHDITPKNHIFANFRQYTTIQKQKMLKKIFN